MHAPGGYKIGIKPTNLSTDPHVFLQTAQDDATGRFPSCHWWGIKIFPSWSSMISLPTLARVVHLQLAIDLAAHRLCTFDLQTSQASPCEVTPDNASRHTLQYVGRICDVAYQ